MPFSGGRALNTPFGVIYSANITPDAGTGSALLDGAKPAVVVPNGPELSDDTTARAQELALDVYRLLGCRGVARVDLMLDEADELWVLETNVIPGMTETSLLPQAADAAGISFDELIARLLDSAFSR